MCKKRLLLMPLLNPAINRCNSCFALIPSTNSNHCHRSHSLVY
uniref:Uncharacterized protein n=1 Tax=Anguilla anguilla TaxID=7936 RepID=A0A0E9WB50_ANGAN